MTVEKAFLAWSGGKDSAHALHRLRLKGDLRVEALLTTVTREYDRISMHGVRRELLEAQAQSIGLPLVVVEIPAKGDNDSYEAAMKQATDNLVQQGFTTAVFGDIFLEDVRKYRINQLRGSGLTPCFPLWGIDSDRLAEDFIDAGFKARLSCVDTEQIDAAFSGRLYDRSLLRDLPKNADPCGENGEFHSFVTDGPIFQQPLNVQCGEMILRDHRFHYCDLLFPPSTDGLELK